MHIITFFQMCLKGVSTREVVTAQEQPRERSRSMAVEVAVGGVVAQPEGIGGEHPPGRAVVGVPPAPRQDVRG